MDLRALTGTAALLLALGGCGDKPAAPVVGDVARGVRYPEPGDTGKSRFPADSLVNPVRGDSTAADRGQRLFASMNCEGCHGEGAAGFVGPSLIDGRWRYGGADGAIFQSIFAGRANGMPGYGAILDAATIWQLVTYLQSQPVPTVVPTTSWP